VFFPQQPPPSDQFRCLAGCARVRAAGPVSNLLSCVSSSCDGFLRRRHGLVPGVSHKRRPYRFPDSCLVALELGPATGACSWLSPEHVALSRVLQSRALGLLAAGRWNPLSIFLPRVFQAQNRLTVFAVSVLPHSIPARPLHAARLAYRSS
jgi:hypothetical protein